MKNEETLEEAIKNNNVDVLRALLMSFISERAEDNDAMLLAAVSIYLANSTNAETIKILFSLLKRDNLGETVAKIYVNSMMDLADSNEFIM